MTQSLDPSTSGTSDTSGTSELRVAVVTGAASGIGEAVARRLIRLRTTVVVADRDQTAANRVAEELRAAGGNAEARAVDVLDHDQIREFWSFVANRFGRCDVLVNSAGVAWLRPFVDLQLAEWNTTLGVNLTGAMLMSQNAADLMVQRHWGRIINVTSVSGLRASIGRSAYGTSKSALTGLTRQMAIELAPHGVTVNAVAPGPVSTPLSEVAHSQATRDAYKRVIPMGRYATSDDVASAIVFLSSDEAEYITGHTIPVDGGYMAAGILDA